MKSSGFFLEGICLKNLLIETQDFLSEVLVMLQATNRNDTVLTAIDADVTFRFLKVQMMSVNDRQIL